MVGTLRVEEALQRLKGVFLELPGTQLTIVEASRLTGVDQDLCRVILGALEDARFVRCGQNGVFVHRGSEV